MFMAMMSSIMILMGASSVVLTDVVGVNAPPLVAESTNTGLEKKHIGIFRLVNTDPVPIEEQDTTRIDKAAVWVENYWKYHTDHKWDVKVKAYHVYTDCNPKAPAYCQTDINNFIDSHDMEGFVPNYFHVWGGYNANYCGQAAIHAQWGVTYNPLTCSELTIVHELGHNFGWHHAGTLDTSTGKDTEYGDHTAIMGGSTMGRQGLISNNYIQEYLDKTFNLIETTQQIILAPVETNTAGLFPNETQHHMIYDGSTTQYTLSLRKELGARFPPRKAAHTVYVHQVRRDGRTKLLNQLPPGSTTTLPNGIQVEYIEYKGERARVNVIVNDGEEIPEEKVIADGFYLPDNAYISASNNGAWYDPTFNGQGFDIQIKDDRAVIYWYTFNTSDHGRRWYYGTCLIDECVTGFPLHSTEFGNFYYPDRADRWLVGDAQFYFTSDRSGVFNYLTYDHGRDSVELSVIATSEANAINGSWYQPDMKGSGMTIQKYGDLLAVYWFTYGPRDPTIYSGTNQTQRWYIALGKVGKVSGKWEMSIYEPQGGAWMWYLAVDLIKVGTATITPNDTLLKFEYSMMAERVTASGTFNLHKLF